MNLELYYSEPIAPATYNTQIYRILFHLKNDRQRNKTYRVQSFCEESIIPAVISSKSTHQLQLLSDPFFLWVTKWGYLQSSFVFQGLLLSFHWLDASLNSTLFRITCLVLSDISGFQTFPGGSRYRAWKSPWARANHSWHSRATFSSSSSSSSILIHHGFPPFPNMCKQGSICCGELGLGFHI